MSISVQTDNAPTGADGGDAAVAKRTKRVRLSGRETPRYAPLFYLSSIGSLLCLALAMPAAIAAMRDTAQLVLVAALSMHLVALGLFTLAKRVREGAFLSAMCFIGLLSWGTALTGGLSSPLLVLFMLAPIEAMLTRRAGYTQLVFMATLVGLILATMLASPMGAGFTMSSFQATLMTTLGVLYALSLAARILRANSLKDVRAQAARRAIEQFHRVTHDVFLIVERDGTVLQAFGALRSVLDCDAGGIARSGLMQRIHVSDRPSFLATLDRVSATGNRDTVDVRLRTGDHDAPQRFIWAEVDLSTLPGSTGEREICALVRDISAVKQRAAELTLAREKAEASDAAKGRFLATMSHELRTPLNAIIGFADILDEEVFGALGNDQQREYVGLIRESGGHLLQLVNDLLDMSKLDAGHFQIVAEPFSLSTVVDRCTRLVSQQIEKAGLTLTIDVPDTFPELVADQRAVRQVLINLLSNACKFTPQGGTITLRARKDAGNLMLSVIDTGIGIAAKDLGKIGQPFFQANNAYDRDHQGTGLGLSVVKGLCELHTGSLSISSVEGEGTTVTVRIPFNGPKTSAIGQTDTNVANTVVLAKLQRERSAANPEPQKAGNLMPEISTPQQDLFEEEGQRAHG
jgi:cell cycle sensor histidine kinase DivJ